MTDPDVLEILRHFPRIYRACHGRHVRRRTTTHGLTDRESPCLGHFSRGVPVTPTSLAEHLSLAPSSLSATLRRLESRGLLERTPRRGDRRVHELRITPAGEEAMAQTSVLDPDRVRIALDAMPPASRRRAPAGLALLAGAAARADAAWRKAHPREARA